MIHHLQVIARDIQPLDLRIVGAVQTVGELADLIVAEIKVDGVFFIWNLDERYRNLRHRGGGAVDGNFFKVLIENTGTTLASTESIRIF